MLFDNPVLQQLKKNQQDNAIIKEGIVKTTDKGYGFLDCDKESYFIPPQHMKNLIHGDKIEAEIIKNGEKTNAKPLKLITPFLTRFVAKVTFKDGYLHIIPDHPSIKNIIRAKNHLKNTIILKNGDWVIANLIEHSMETNKPHVAEITEFITNENNPQAPWWVVLRGFDLPKEPLYDNEEYPLLEKDIPRTDLTHLPFVTIDSEKTKDMDDALYIEKLENGGFKLSVAIADPTAYIAEDDKLDKYASVRAFSIYLPGRDIPMLPRTLSDDLCSLVENVERNVLVGCMNIGPDGKLDENIKFELATIKSHGKLIYDKISDLLEGKETDFTPTETVLEQIKLLEEFALLSANYRAKNTTVFKEKPEYEFVLNEEGALADIIITKRRIANRIVEEAMIAANTCAGRFLAERFNSGIFNTHSGFDPIRIGELKDFLKEIGYQELDTETLLTKESFLNVKRFVDQLDNEYYDARLRKYLSFGQICTTPGTHCGLGIDFYATWTSPIRKYGDMINHRLIKSTIIDQSHPKIPNEETLELMNAARKINKLAERNVKDWLYVKYLEPMMKDRTIFNAEIFDLSRGGIRVRFLENGASAFIPASFICKDRQAINVDQYKMQFLINGEVYYQLTDIIKVSISSINFENRSVIAQLEE